MLHCILTNTFCDISLNILIKCEYHKLSWTCKALLGNTSETLLMVTHEASFLTLGQNQISVLV